MDKRCPRQLTDKPDAPCPLAVLRLKALRNAGRELTEEEEDKLPGCPFAIKSQLSHYCFFKMASDLLNESPMSDIEVANAMCLSVDTVRKLEKQAFNKLKAAGHLIDASLLERDPD